MKPGDPLPIDVDLRLAPGTFVGEVVMKQETTPFLLAAQAKGCPFQIGTDMLFEQILAYLEFFGFPAPPRPTACASWRRSSTEPAAPGDRRTRSPALRRLSPCRRCGRSGPPAP
ncbi:MAG: hypothetical protein U1E17_09310 [Geminicoccaceae bacterium]